MLVFWGSTHSHRIHHLKHLSGATAPASLILLRSHHWHLSPKPFSSCRTETLHPDTLHPLPLVQPLAATVLLSAFIILMVPITQSCGLVTSYRLGVCNLVCRLPCAQNSSILWPVLRFPFWFSFFCLWWCWRSNSGYSPCDVSPLRLSLIPRQDSLPF